MIHKFYFTFRVHQWSTKSFVATENQGYDHMRTFNTVGFHSMCIVFMYIWIVQVYHLFAWTRVESWPFVEVAPLWGWRTVCWSIMWY